MRLQALLLTSLFLAACAGSAVDDGARDAASAVDVPGVQDSLEPVDLEASPDRKPLPDLLEDVAEDVPISVDVPSFVDVLDVVDAIDGVDLLGPEDTAIDAGEDVVDVVDAEDIVDTWQEDIPVLPCGGEPLMREDAGDLRDGVPIRMRPFQPCSEQRLWFVAAEGFTVSIELHPFAAMGDLDVVVTYPDNSDWEEPLASLVVEAGATQSLEFQPPRSGEFALLLRTVDPEASGVFDVRLDCVAGCDRETTRFPVVMVHGWTGWADIGTWDYFYEVPGTVQDQGFEVFVASLDPYNSIVIRSGQLAVQLDQFLADGRARKVNIIAHSQGGLDSRYVISTLGYFDRVSSLTTVSTPHRGTELTDVALGLLPGFGENVLALLLEWLGATVVGSESDAIASFESMTTDYVRNEFNPANPNHADVDYISYAGRTCLYAISCDDMCDIEIRWSYDILVLAAGDNDGIVPVDSAIWGDFRGEIPADHFDEVGQLFGVTNANFEHRSWYLERFRDLAAEGH